MNEKEILDDYTQLCLDHLERLENMPGLQSTKYVKIYHTLECVLKLYLEKSARLERAENLLRKHNIDDR